jgi:hypothetical protein
VASELVKDKSKDFFIIPRVSAKATGHRLKIKNKLVVKPNLSTFRVTS